MGKSKLRMCLEAVILSKMIFLPFKKAGAHLQCVCNIYAKFQKNCLKTVGGAAYTNFFQCDRQNFNMFEGCSCMKNNFFPFKK